MASLGFRTWDEMVGRVDMLEADPDVRNWKSAGVDLSAILSPAVVGEGNTGVICCVPQDHGLEQVLDRTLIQYAEPAMARGEKVEVELPIRNTDRATGTLLSHTITRRIGADALAEDSVQFRFKGSAGQSFGAWLSTGVTMELEGDANDYVGKGLSGGRLMIYPPRGSSFKAEENVIIGNVALYGAIRGRAYFRGMAAERFCVRNSGAHVVVEGVGDHGCEYMTGGRAVILGSTGRNFAAGMSGGIAYVWDRDGSLSRKLNTELVEACELDQDDISCIKTLVDEHWRYTGSVLAEQLLGAWDEHEQEFVKVISPAFREVMELQQLRDKELVHG